MGPKVLEKVEELRFDFKGRTWGSVNGSWKVTSQDMSIGSLYKIVHVQRT